MFSFFIFWENGVSLFSPPLFFFLLFYPPSQCLLFDSASLPPLSSPPEDDGTFFSFRIFCSPTFLPLSWTTPLSNFPFLLLREIVPFFLTFQSQVDPPDAELLFFKTAFSWARPSFLLKEDLSSPDFLTNVEGDLLLPLLPPR